MVMHQLSVQPHIIHTFLKVSEWNGMNPCSPSATWLSRTNTILMERKYNLLLKSTLQDIKDCQAKHGYHIALIWIKTWLIFPPAYISTSCFLKSCHHAGRTWVPGSHPARHRWLSIRGRVCYLQQSNLFEVIQPWAPAVLRNFGRYRSGISSTGWTKLLWIVPSELPFPMQLLHRRESQCHSAYWPPPLPRAEGSLPPETLCSCSI